MCFNLYKYGAYFSLVLVLSGLPCFSATYTDLLSDGNSEGTFFFSGQGSLGQGDISLGNGLLLYSTKLANETCWANLNYAVTPFFGDFVLEVDFTYFSTNVTGMIYIGMLESFDGTTYESRVGSDFSSHWWGVDNNYWISHDRSTIQNYETSTFETYWNTNTVEGLSPGISTAILKREFGVVKYGFRDVDGLEHFGNFTENKSSAIGGFYIHVSPNTSTSTETRIYLHEVRLSGEVFDGQATGVGSGPVDPNDPNNPNDPNDPNNPTGDTTTSDTIIVELDAGTFTDASGITTGTMSTGTFNLTETKVDSSSLNMISMSTYSERDISDDFMAKFSWLDSFGTASGTFEITLPLADVGVGDENKTVDVMQTPFLATLAGLVRTCTTFVISLGWIMGVKHIITLLTGS